LKFRGRSATKLFSSNSISLGLFRVFIRLSAQAGD
jgi:hypothetical protein